MMKFFGLRGLAVVGLSVLAGGAYAVDLLPGLFNTGQDGSPHANLAAGIADPHYALTVNPETSSLGAVVEDTLPGTWLAPTVVSQWIGPTQNAGAGVAVGDYVYRYTLNLTGYIASTAVFAGQWSTDNNGVIYVNGAATTNTTGYEAFGAFHAFALGPALFTGGVNNIDFHVYNGGGPSGLRVEWLSGSATPVPEPFTMALAGCALAGAVRRRARRA